MLAAVLSGAAGWLQARTGWQASVAAFLAGAAAVLGQAPFFAWPVFGAAILVLLLLLDGPQPGLRRGVAGRVPALRAAAWRGFAFGFGYFLAGMSWVGNAFLVDAERFAALMPVAVTALPAGLALFWAAGGAIYRLIEPGGPGRVLVFAGVFGLVEVARGHWFTGLPWNLPAYIWRPDGWVAQSGSLIGAYGVSALTLLVLAAPLALLPARSGSAEPAAAGRGRGLLVAGLAAGLAVAALGFGAVRLAGAGAVGSGAGPGAPLIAAGQAGFSQREVWDPANRQRIVDSYMELLADPAIRDADVVVWPEGALPALLLEEPQITDRIDALLGDRHLVMGILRRDTLPEPDGAVRTVYYNSVGAIGRRTGALSLDALYDKHHLVPFGEYLPLQPLFGALGLESLVSIGSGFEPGPAPGLLQVPGLPPADARVCYEIIFPSYNDFSNATAGWMLNVSVDAWYGDGLGPEQHYSQARWRAIETGLPVIRAASGGWSGIIDPYGRAVSQHRQGAGYALGRLPTREFTVFTRAFMPATVVIGIVLVLIAGLVLRPGNPALTSVPA